jgi:hypothetical protein
MKKPSIDFFELRSVGFPSSKTKRLEALSRPTDYYAYDNSFAMFPIVQNTPGLMHILFLIGS